MIMLLQKRRIKPALGRLGVLWMSALNITVWALSRPLSVIFGGIQTAKLVIMLNGHFVDVWKCSFNYFKGALWRGMHVCIDIICVDVCMILNRSDQTKHRGPLPFTGLHTSKDPRQRKDIVMAIFCMDNNCTKMWEQFKLGNWALLWLGFHFVCLFVCCCCRCCCWWWWWRCWSGGGDVDIFTNSSHGDCQIKTSVLSVATVWVEAFNICVRVSLTVMNVCKGHTCLVTLVTEIPAWSHLTLKYLHGHTWHWNNNKSWCSAESCSERLF